MMTQPAPQRHDDADQDATREVRKEARLRAAACRARLRLASDALAAADLLLAMNFSVRSVGTEPKPVGTEPKS